MSQYIETLLANETATGEEVDVGAGGDYIFDVAGNFAGATVKLQRKASDDATWLDVGDEATLTAAGHCVVTVSAGKYRAHVAGGAPTGLYSQLRRAY